MITQLKLTQCSWPNVEIMYIFYFSFLPASFSARVRASVVLELDGASSALSVVGGFNMFSIENGDASMLISNEWTVAQFIVYIL